MQGKTPVSAYFDLSRYMQASQSSVRDLERELIRARSDLTQGVLITTSIALINVQTMLNPTITLSLDL